MTWVVLALSAVLAAIAAAGVLSPFMGRSAVGSTRLADPLDDERASLLRALRDLDDERATGTLDERDYRILRAETEARAIAVLRALEERDGEGRLAAEVRELRSPRPGAVAVGSPLDNQNGHLRPRRGPSRWTGAAVTAALVLGVTVPLLVGALRSRSADEPITGSSVAAGEQIREPLAFFERRVRQHPRDVAARLDLGQRYLDVGATGPAFAQYQAALRLDPRNAEALANLGYLLHRAGRPSEGYEAVQAALQAAPRFPQALYYKGLILLRGLDRPSKAAAAFRAYLDAAPFGARRAEVHKILTKISP